MEDTRELKHSYPHSFATSIPHGNPPNTFKPVLSAGGDSGLELLLNEFKELYVVVWDAITPRIREANAITKVSAI